MHHPLSTIVKLKPLHPGVEMPAYQHEGDAAMDVRAFFREETLKIGIPPGEGRLIHTGFAMQIEPGFEAQLRQRSGLGSKGIIIPNAPATIDSGYRGEVMVALWNLTRETFIVTHGDRIAQMVIAALPKVQSVTVAELDESSRGTGGFGSTGR